MVQVQDTNEESLRSIKGVQQVDVLTKEGLSQNLKMINQNSNEDVTLSAKWLQQTEV